MKNILANLTGILKSRHINFIIADSDNKIIIRYTEKGKLQQLKTAKNIEDILKNAKLVREGNRPVLQNGDIVIVDFPEHNQLLLLDKSEQSICSAEYLVLLYEIVNSTSEAIVLIDKQNRIVFGNDVFLSRFGFKIDEVYNSLFIEFLPPEYFEKVIHSIKESRRTNVDIHIYNKIGDMVPSSLTSMRWYDHNLIIIRDRTETEGYYKEIEGLKKMQKLVFDSITQGLLVLDKDTNIIQFNKFMEDKYRFSTKDMIGKSIFDVIPGLKELGLEKVFVDIIETKKVRRISGLKRFSNRLESEIVQNLLGYPLIEQGKCVGVVILIEDVTGKMIMEEEFEIARKKSMIINDLNGILTQNLDLENVIFSVSEYMFKSIKANKIVFVNNINLSATEFVKKAGIEEKKLKTDRAAMEFMQKYSEDRIFTDRKSVEMLTGRKSIKEAVLIPVDFKGRTLGYFVLECHAKISNKRMYTEFIDEFSKHIGYILDKSVMYEEKKHNLYKLEFILKISRILSQSKDYSNTFRNLIETIKNELNADRCFFVIKGELEDELMPIAAMGLDSKDLMLKKFSYQRGIVGYVARTKEALLLENALKFKGYEYTKGYRKRKQAMICVPVIFKGDLVGVLTLTRFGDRYFNEEDFELVKIIASQAASNVKNLILQMQMEDQIEQLSILYKISTSVRSIINYGFLKKVIVSSLSTLAHSNIVLFWERKGSNYSVSEHFFSDTSKRSYLKQDAEIPEGRIEFKEQGMIAYLDHDDRIWQKVLDVKPAKGTVLHIQMNPEHEFLLMLIDFDNSQRKIKTDTYLALIHELAIKIENALLFDENERKLRQYTTISEITKKLVTLTNLEDYFTHLLESAKNIVDGTYATILMKEGNELAFTTATGMDIKKIKHVKLKIGEGAAGYVAKTGKPMIINNVQKDRHFKTVPNLSNIYEVYNLINIPLIYKGNVMGVLCVDNKKSGNFNENDLEFIQTLANTAIIAIEHFMELEIGEKLSDIILDTIPSGILYISNQGKIKHVNYAFSVISGYNARDVVDQSYSRIFKDRGSVIDNVLRSEKPALRQEIKLIRNDGQEIPCGISITPIGIKNRFDIVCVIQDLSQIKKIQQELKEKENLALLGQMAAGMAHEIKNPLAGILTGMEFLHMQVGEQDIYRESMELVIREVKRLDRIVNDMTSFAKSKIRILSHTSLKELIKRAVELTKDRAGKKNVSIEMNFNMKNETAELDEEQILEVIINIILNAVQAIGENGAIKIDTLADDEKCIISIFNTGPQIPPEIIEKIFTPFFTTKSGGTGLGLPISYNIIKEHGGRIKVINEKDGVTFRITLPLKAENA